MLEGVFQDEHGDYPAGTYVRNPPTSSHTPGSEPGCTIFVKLSQFHPDDWTPVRIETSELRFSHAPDVPGVKFAVLHESAWELVLLERWAPGISIAVPVPEGIELLVLDGSFIEGGEEFTRLSWLRLPAGAMLQATAGRGGCKVWVKSAVWRMSRGCHLRPDIVKRIRISASASAATIWRVSSAEYFSPDAPFESFPGVTPDLPSRVCELRPRTERRSPW